MKKIKFSKSNIEEHHITKVNNILKSGWLTHGKYTKLFEDKFKNFTKSKYAITVSSCTAALHLSCIASGFKKGDEIIVPSQTHTATAHAVEFTGAKAIFADIDYYTGNISYKNILKKISKRTKGLIIVHMAGEPCDLHKIISLCKEKKIILLEDCAHSLGSYFDNKHLGNFGKTGSFSFYPTKQITTGEGGMIITNNLIFYKKIKLLKAFGIDKSIEDRKKPGDYNVRCLGYNYRMTDFQSALGYFQICNYKKNLKRRHEIANLYIKLLHENKNIYFLPYNKNSSYFVFQIFCTNRDKVLAILKKLNIGVSVHYLKPVTAMYYYKKKYNIKESEYKNSNKYSKRNISLPVYPKLTNLEIKKICKVLVNHCQ